MKLKNYWKRFWTLDRHHAAGFTLVELIVVIAILAILAGVGIPVYSGYITKANKQADITLISDIEYALTVAGYADTFADGESGTIILSTTGISGITADSGADKALKAAFGDNYATTLKLKYDSWGTNGMVNTLDPERAWAIDESSYMTGGRVDDLLPDVEKMTGMATNLVTALGSGGGMETTLAGLFTGDNGCAIDAVAAKYGITKADGETWDQWGAKPENSTAFGNLLVLTAAADAANYGDNATTGTNMVMEFSGYYALAATNPEFSAELDAALNDLQSINSASAGKTWYDALSEKAVAAGYVAPDFGDMEAGIEPNQAAMDLVAFQSIMMSLNNPTEDQIKSISKDLNNANLFTDGVVNGMYNDYLDMVDSMAGMYDADTGTFPTITVGEGEVAILFSQNAANIAVSNTLPE